MERYEYQEDATWSEAVLLGDESRNMDEADCKLSGMAVQTMVRSEENQVGGLPFTCVGWSLWSHAGDRRAIEGTKNREDRKERINTRLALSVLRQLFESPQWQVRNHSNMVMSCHLLLPASLLAFGFHHDCRGPSSAGLSM